MNTIKFCLALFLGSIVLICMLACIACALVAVALIGAWLLSLIGVPLSASFPLHPLLLAVLLGALAFVIFIVAAVVAKCADTVL